MINSARGRVLLGLTIAIASLAALLWVLQKRAGYDESRASLIENRSRSSTAVAAKSSADAAIAPPPETPSSSTHPPQASPNIDSTLLPESMQTPDPSSTPDSFIGNLKLIIPVAGVRPEQVTDTFADARAGGRVHDAIDIPAPPGTPVFAAVDGEIIRLFQSERGGTTIYQFSTDKKLVFYYAHLQRYAEGLFPGKFARQGETIAYVGDTGNAGAGNYHLHFSISIIANSNRYWEGTNINPYPLLRR
jgi:murein DD-endopeptidase MepM/ murein hydrolase activator NlpD